MSFRCLCRMCCLGAAMLIAVAAAGLAAEHTTDSLDQVRSAIAENRAVLIDVREQREWDAGHLRDASLVPLSAIPQLIEERKIAGKLPKDKIIYCHCRSGGRVLTAADLLRVQGYDIRPLKQGYADLINGGFPVAPAN